MRRPGRRRVLVGALALALVSGLGLGMAAWAGRSHPTPPPSRQDDALASRGDVRTGQPTPDATALSPSATPSPSAAPATPGPRPTSTTGAGTRPGAAGPSATSRTTAPARPPSGQRTVKAYVTGYSYFDNTPAGSVEISHPVLHQSAGGTGTYANPITVAVGHSFASGRDVLDWPAGTRFYIPNLRRYFIVEDTCGDGSSPQNGPCHIGYPAPATTWLDIWIGGKGGTTSGSDACMNSITDVWDVVVNPASTYATVAGGVYGPAGCTKQYGNAVVTG